MIFYLSSTNAHGNIANKIYDLPSAFLAKTWLSARHKVFRPGKGKHHMVMHDDGCEGNIMYLREYKNEARTRSLFKDTLRILSCAPLTNRLSFFSFLANAHVKFTMRMHASGCDLFHLHTRDVNYKQWDERNEKIRMKRSRTNEILIYDVNNGIATFKDANSILIHNINTGCILCAFNIFFYFDDMKKYVKKSIYFKKKNICIKILEKFQCWFFYEIALIFYINKFFLLFSLIKILS